MPDQTASPLIELRAADVLSAYTNEVVVSQVDWQISPGDFWVVGGMYGSGKTDLLSTAACVQRPGSGSLLLFGQDTNGLHEPDMVQLRKRIGLVFKHGGRMFANFTVQENVALALRYHKNLGPVESANEIAIILEQTGLTDFTHRIASTLGPNLRARVGLGRALALRPEVLLLDEPLIGLDVQAQRWMIEFLRKISAAPDSSAESPKVKAIAIATNHFGPWIDRGTRFAILKDKRLLALAGREQLKGEMLETTDA